MKSDLRRDSRHQLVRQTGLGLGWGGEHFKFLSGPTCQICDESASIVNSRCSWKHIPWITANPDLCIFHHLITLMFGLIWGNL